ncbi:MAG: hypothetical protein IKY94_01965 [Lachnospiraceae bacterium]|nr:hypothetical protein [Lachnospiraceae bacterium]
MDEKITLDMANVGEEQLPEIIRNEMAGLSEFKAKADAAKVKAREAKALADELEGVKFGKTKAAVEDLQKATRAITDAQICAAEAQEKSFEYQEQLAKTSKYLFGLGVTSIAMNRAVVRQLKLTLEGCDSGEIDDSTHQEILNVISKLKEQEDIMQKQEIMSGRIDLLDDEVATQGVELKRQEQKDEEHDLLLEINEKKDAEQDNELHEQAVKDKEHDAKILELQERIKDLENKIETFNMHKIKMQMGVVILISVGAMFFSIVALLF